MAAYLNAYRDVATPRPLPRAASAISRRTRGRTTASSRADPAGVVRRSRCAARRRRRGRATGDPAIDQCTRFCREPRRQIEEGGPRLHHVAPICRPAPHGLQLPRRDRAPRRGPPRRSSAFCRRSPRRCSACRSPGGLSSSISLFMWNGAPGEYVLVGTPHDGRHARGRALGGRGRSGHVVARKATRFLAARPSRREAPSCVHHCVLRQRRSLRSYAVTSGSERYDGARRRGSSLGTARRLFLRADGRLAARRDGRVV